jgi:hypothetical protein
VAKNAYTFAKRSKELAKKKKKEEKEQRKGQRGENEEGPYFDEATGEIVYPKAADSQDAAETSADAEIPSPTPDAAERP